MILPFHIVHRGNMHFWGKYSTNLKTKKIPSRKEIALELLHNRLGHSHTRSFFAGDTDNVLGRYNIIVDPYHVFHIMPNFLNEQKGWV